MGLIKLIIKLLVLPLIVAVTMIQWVGIFFTQFSTRPSYAAPARTPPRYSASSRTTFPP